MVQDRKLLYVGISPRTYKSAARTSRQTLRSRLRYHYRGNAYGSTLRLTLGCLLQETLDIRLQRVGSGTRLTFGDGEAKLTAWMAEQTRVAWLQHPQPELIERAMIQELDLPLNLADNAHHPFRAQLSSIRGEARAAARLAPRT
jgi:hypothetical protein